MSRTTVAGRPGRVYHCVVHIIAQFAWGLALATLAAPVFAQARPQDTVELELIEAVQRRDVGAVRTLIADGVDVRHTRDDGSTPLAWAALRGDTAITAALLRAGADITRLSYTTDPYIRRVRAAGGFRAYMRVHRDQLMLNFAPKFPRLPPQMVRRILVFWLHAGCY